MKGEVTVKRKIDDIYVDISWSNIAHNYFNKSSSWLYNKMKGIDGNGGKGDFTDEEKLQFKGALCDLAERIRRAADSV